MARSSSARVLLVVLVVLVGAALGVRWLARSTAPPPAALVSGDDADDASRDRRVMARELLDQFPSHLDVGGDPLGGVDAGGAWARVDLEAVRRAMPENLYWKLGAPTQDPDVEQWRAEERARWNAEYGKVLSNTATAEEVDAYYAHQQLLSSDYLEFVVHVLTHYGDVIPERDAGLLKLAGEMHLAKLEEIPRKIAEAHERREAQEEARRAWLAEQEAFASGSGANP